MVETIKIQYSMNGLNTRIEKFESESLASEFYNRVCNRGGDAIYC